MARQRAREETRNEQGTTYSDQEGQGEEREEEEHRRKGGVGDFSCNYYLLAP